MPIETRSAASKQAEVEEIKNTKEDVSKYYFHPGHIYFFYRPKVEHEYVYSIDNVRDLHMLLVPHSSPFGVHEDQSTFTKGEEEMTVLAEVVPAAETLDQPKKHYRLLTIGKKWLPEAEGGHEVFWATVTTVGDNLHRPEGRFKGKT